MNCQEAKTYLDAYIDGELGAPDAGEFERHAAGCDSCARALRERRALVGHLAIAAPRYAAPDDLRRRMTDRLAEPGYTSIPIRVRRTPWRNYGLVAAAILLAATVPLLVRSMLVAAEARSTTHLLVAAHAQALMSAHLIDVASGDRHTVKPWFSGKVAFAPLVPDLKEQGFELVGGRLASLRDHPVAAIVYRIRQHTIDVFMWDAAAGTGELAPTRTMLQGFSLVRWVHNGLECWAISDADGETLLRLAELIRSSGEVLPAAGTGQSGR